MIPCKNWSSTTQLVIHPLLTLPIDEVQTYWQTLYMNDTLKYRLANVKDPAWDSVVKMITRMGQSMFMVKEDDRVVAEFMLERPTGHAAQIHFSMHPDNPTRYSYNVARTVVDTMIEQPGLSTLFGLTPLKNRAACLFNLKIGFKKLGILPKSIVYLGSVEDAMVCVRSNGR